MGTTMRKIRVSVVGKVQDAEKIPGWMRENGGAFSKAISRNVTHLIASEEAYTANVEAVQKAKKLGTVKIVSFDWIEDSLCSRTRRPKPEEPYLWKNLLRAETEKPAKDPWNANKIIKYTGGRKGNKSPPLPKQRIFRDAQTGETWEVTITRAGLTPRSREKYTLGIFETTTEPHTYAAFAKYSRVGRSKVEPLTPAKSDKTLAIKVFKEFFKQETGKDWEDRADGKMPAPKTDKDGNILPAQQSWYVIEANGNLFTDWMKEYQGPDESGDNMTVTVASGLAEADHTEAGREEMVRDDEKAHDEEKSRVEENVCNEGKEHNEGEACDEEKAHEEE